MAGGIIDIQYTILLFGSIPFNSLKYSIIYYSFWLGWGGRGGVRLTNILMVVCRRFNQHDLNIQVIYDTKSHRTQNENSGGRDLDFEV